MTTAQVLGLLMPAFALAFALLMVWVMRHTRLGAQHPINSRGLGSKAAPKGRELI
jgi:hypothetical protein